MVTNTTQNHNLKARKQSIKTKKVRSCREKKTYKTLAEAMSSANHLHGKGIYVKPYQCSICNKFHVTKRDKVSVLNDLFKLIEKDRLKKEKSY